MVSNIKYWVGFGVFDQLVVYSQVTARLVLPVASLFAYSH
jgi:hypothetical protein